MHFRSSVHREIVFLHISKWIEFLDCSSADGESLILPSRHIRASELHTTRDGDDVVVENIEQKNYTVRLPSGTIRILMIE